MRRLAVLFACALALPVSVAHAWTWPVDGPVLRSFSFDRAHPYAGGQHRGLDISASTGSPVRAPVTGVISFAGTVPTGGKTVSIQAPSGYTATLVHLGSIGVKRGDTVGEGSVVGTVGPSGVVDLAEPFVYFGVRVTRRRPGLRRSFAPAAATDGPGHAGSAAPATAAASAPAAPAVPAEPVVKPKVADPPAASAQEPASGTGEAGSEATTEAGAREATPTDEAGAEPSVQTRAVPGAENGLEARRASSGERTSEPRPRSLDRPTHPRSHAQEHRVVLDRRALVERSSASARTDQRVAAESADTTDPKGVSGSGTWRLLRSESPTSSRHDAGGSGAVSRGSSNAGIVRPLLVTTIPVALAGALVLFLLLRRAGNRRAARIMSLPEPEPAVGRQPHEAEDSRSARLAVCIGEEAPGPRGGVRRPGRHLRALPPPEGQRRADGERDGRAWDAGDGLGRSRGRLAA